MNKVYFFIIDDDQGGVYIAAPTHKEAKKIALDTELIQNSHSYNAFIEIRGHICKPRCTEKYGELSVIDLNELGLLWWECNNDEVNDGYCGGEDFEFIDDCHCKCKKCGHRMDIPYAGM